MVEKVITALVMGGIMAAIGIFILKDVQIAIMCALMMAIFVFIPKKKR